MRFPLSLLAFAAGSLAAAPVPKDFKKPDDATALLGTWVAHTLHGTPGKPHTHTFVFEPDGKCHTLYGAGQRSDWTFTLDPKATPKRMKWVSAGARGANFDCVYEVSGDTLKVGFLAVAGQPVADQVEPGPGVTLYEMARDKSAK